MKAKDEKGWKNGELLKNTAYIYYPGKGDSQGTAALLTGGSFIATTGETVSTTCPGISIIPPEQVWNYPELPENDLNPSVWGSIFYAPTKLRRRNLNVSKENEGTPPFSLKEEGQGSLSKYSVDYAKSSMGQGTDVAAHKVKVAAVEEYNKQQDENHKINSLVLIGESRGGATTFRAVAENNYADVKLCILLVPPASMQDVSKNKLGKPLAKKIYNEDCLGLVSSVCGDKHKTDKTEQAVSYVKDFPNDIPLIIVSSKKDELVPHSSSAKFALRVAEKRQEAKREGEDIAPVYFLQLDECDHNNSATNNSTDSKRVQNFVHSVYRDLSMPYIEEYAEQGEFEFATSEFTQGLLGSQVKFQNEFKRAENDEERSKIRTQALSSFKNDEVISTCNYRDKKRLASLASVMPLYSKPLAPTNSIITEAQLAEHLLEGHRLTLEDLIEQEIEHLEQSKGGFFTIKPDLKIKELKLLQKRINLAKPETYGEVIKKWADEECLYVNELGMHRRTARSTMINQHRNFFSDLFAPITKEKSRTEKFIEQLMNKYGDPAIQGDDDNSLDPCFNC